MSIPFTKASACGNDFLIIDGGLAPPDLSDFTRRICDRHRGVGADGVEWLFPAPGVDTKADLINADGSPAEISGNGTRCVAAYLCAEQHRETLLVGTGAGTKTCVLTAHSGNRYEFETDMGIPVVDAEFAVHTGRGEVRGRPVSMGNPHFVVFVSEFQRQWQELAAEIQRDPQFPHGVNVEFVHVVGPNHIEVRFFERGVGETQSSGTGSCASAVAAIAGKHTQSPVRVEAAGGAQVVHWNEQVFLRGSAELICCGEFFG